MFILFDQFVLKARVCLGNAPHRRGNGVQSEDNSGAAERMHSPARALVPAIRSKTSKLVISY